MQLIRAEYEETPGLSLTRTQARRLWGLDAETCDTLLNTMVAERVLCRTAADMYVRATADC
jgi:hypothetical protein